MSIFLSYPRSNCIKQLLSQVIKTIQMRFNYTWVSSWLKQPNHADLVLEACTGTSLQSGVLLSPRADGLATQAWQRGMTVYENNAIKNRVLLTMSGLRVAFSEVAIPLMFQNEIMGILDIQSERMQAFSTEDISVLKITASQIAIAIHNARLYSELERLTAAA